ncbi:hypothetical protein DFH08DRAFT_809992 [Mycena albidolilacea]|uniref:Uncharacterized protein n=1 Tax=Mycena albidolilacea TaxID=1033008 RepID=A0AAD7A003_9AGAR|nr:hypothetical protein DFH08DRAFT_809992 [Mycena albidolilacea]
MAQFVINRPCLDNIKTISTSVLQTVSSLLSAISFNSDSILGALLVLYTIKVLQMLVSSAIVLDSVLMIANYASVYLFDPLYVFTVGVVAVLAQIFLATQYWLLSPALARSRTKNKFITITLFFFITVEAGSAFASGATLAVFPQYKDQSLLNLTNMRIWLVTEAVTDVSIALAFLLEFWKIKSPIKETRSLVNRLVVQTIQTGTAGATIALVVLIA